MLIYCSDCNLPNLLFCVLFPLLMDLSSHKSYSDLYYPFLWYRVSCNGRLPLSLVDYNNFTILLTCIKLYYFVDAGSWRRNHVTSFKWFISSCSLNWLPNISFVWTSDEWFHQTTGYFFFPFLKWQTGKTFLYCFSLDLYSADLMSAAPQWTQTGFMDLDP